MTEGHDLPKGEARAKAQRERILAAAKLCFIKYGFDSASMANIAETANMSAGLIYRYFTGKDAIILAIIEQQLQLAREEIARLDGSFDLPQAIWQSFGGEACTPERRMDPALFLEMSAEASRNPEIAAAVRSSDLILRSEFRQWLGRSRAEGGLGIPEARTEVVALLLQCLIEGLKIREMREPDLDRTVLKTALEEFLPILLTPER